MKARFVVMAAVLLLAVVLAWGGTAWADQSAAPVDPSVLTELDAAGGGTVPVIVYASPGHLADLTAEINPATMDDSLSLIGAVSASVTSSSLAALEALPYVDYIAADVPTFGTDYSDSLDVTNATIGLGAITPPTQGGLDGTGVGVAVLDSGSADVPDLDGANGQPRVVAFVDFVNRRRHMYDDGGHGTFVDGIIAGDGAMSLPTDQGGKATTQYRGVAPNANIISLKVLDRQGQGRASSLIAAIGWAIAHRQQYNIRVMNISVEGDVTCPAAYDPLDRAVDAAWQAGIVVVCAAGNEGAFGEGGILSPGNDPYAITVGASDTQQTADPSDDAVCSTARSGRRSTTSTPSPTWSPRGTTSSRCAHPAAGSTPTIRRLAWRSRATFPARRPGGRPPTPSCRAPARRPLSSRAPRRSSSSRTRASRPATSSCASWTAPTRWRARAATPKEPVS